MSLNIKSAYHRSSLGKAPTSVDVEGVDGDGDVEVAEDVDEQRRSLRCGEGGMQGRHVKECRWRGKSTGKGKERQGTDEARQGKKEAGNAGSVEGGDRGTAKGKNSRSVGHADVWGTKQLSASGCGPQTL